MKRNRPRTGFFIVKRSDATELGLESEPSSKPKKFGLNSKLRKFLN